MSLLIPWPLLALLLVLTAACSNDDDVIASPYTRPEFNNVATTPRSGTPQEQIDRFVEANGMDTVVSSSGLVYVIEDAGSGQRPVDTSRVATFYEGYFVDGQLFDNGGGRAATFRLAQVIPAWTEGLQLLENGGKIWMLVRPSLAYGTAGRPESGIDASTVLVFEVALVDVLDE